MSFTLINIWLHGIYDTGFVIVNLTTISGIKIYLKKKLYSTALSKCVFEHLYKSTWCFQKVSSQVRMFFKIIFTNISLVVWSLSSPVMKKDLLLCPHRTTPSELHNCVPNQSKPRLSSLGQDFSCGSPSTSIFGNLLL